MNYNFVRQMYKIGTIHRKDSCIDVYAGYHVSSISGKGSFKNVLYLARTVANYGEFET